MTITYFIKTKQMQVNGKAVSEREFTEAVSAFFNRTSDADPSKTN